MNEKEKVRKEIHSSIRMKRKEVFYVGTYYVNRLRKRKNFFMKSKSFKSFGSSRRSLLFFFFVVIFQNVFEDLQFYHVKNRTNPPIVNSSTFIRNPQSRGSSWTIWKVENSFLKINAKVKNSPEKFFTCPKEITETFEYLIQEKEKVFLFFSPWMWAV